MPAERHQTTVGETPLPHLLIKFQLVSDAVQPRRRDKHRPPLPFNRLCGLRGEVLEDNPGFGLNAVGLQVNVVGQGPQRPRLLVLFILRHPLDQLEVPLKGGVVLQHVQREILR